jgi:flagellar hook-length control protein FliK
VTTPLAARPAGGTPAVFPGARGTAGRSGADRGDAFASLLGAVGAGPDEAPGQERSERSDRCAAHERGAQQPHRRELGDRARDEVADRREAAARSHGAARNDAARRDEATHRREAAQGQQDAAVSRREAAEGRRDDAVTRSERAALRRQSGERSQAAEDSARATDCLAEAQEETVPTSGDTATGADEAAGTEGSSASPLVEPGAQVALPPVVVPALPAGVGQPTLATGSELLQSLVGGVPGAADTAQVRSSADGPEPLEAPGVLVPVSVAAAVAGEEVAVGTVPAPPPGSDQSAVATAAGVIEVTFLDPSASLPGGTPVDPAQGAPEEPVAPSLVAPESSVVDTLQTGATAEDVALPSASAAAPATGPARTEPVVAGLGAPDAPLRADGASAEEALLRTNIGATVAELARAAQRDGSGATRVVIRLDPPELGTVTVALTVRAGEVRVNLLAADVAAVAALDARRTDIDHALADSGLSLGGFDVRSDSRQGQEQPQHGRDRASSAGRPWRALGADMDFERAAAVDRAARGVWL